MASYLEILKSLKNKEFKPVYFLYGDESFFIDEISDYIEQHILQDAEKAFNQTICYGKDTDPLTLLDTLQKYPMMSEYQVVLLKEAQQMKNIAELKSYIEQPLKSTIFVICYKNKTLDKRTAFAKTITKYATVLESKKLYDNKVPAWINEYLKHKKYNIEPKAAFLLTEYLGADLSKISNELKKLILNLNEGETITPNLIQMYSGINKDFNVYELNKALSTKDIVKSNRIVNYFINNPKANPFVVTLGAMFGYFSKIMLMHTNANKSDQEKASILKVNPFFLGEYKTAANNFSFAKCADIIDYLHQSDLKSKGVENRSLSDGDLLKELVYKILH